MDYNGYATTEHIAFINPKKLKGDFTKTQAKRFFEKYDLLIHQPKHQNRLLCDTVSK